MKKIIAVSAILSLLVVSGFALFQYNKPHKSLSNIDADFVLSSVELYSNYSQDEEAADSKYLDKIIEVRGKILEIQTDNNQIGLLLGGSDSGMGFVTCSMNPTEKNKINSLKQGEYALVKGVCTGYLMDVVLTKCIIVN